MKSPAVSLEAHESTLARMTQANRRLAWLAGILAASSAALALVLAKRYNNGKWLCSLLELQTKYTLIFFV